MKKTLVSALTACVILGSVQITGMAYEMPKFITKICKVYPAFCQVIQQQKPQQKPEEQKPEIQQPEVQKPETNAPQTNGTVNSFENEVLSLVNAERAKNGLKALTLDISLSGVAQKHSEDMAKNNYFSHTSLSGLSPFDRIKNAGISYKTAGENIAAGQTTAAQVVNSWMNSEGHRKNILNASFTKMGLGFAKANSGYKTYWTQLFIG